MGCDSFGVWTSTGSTPSAQEGDVQLIGKTPYYFTEGKYHPICGHYFWDNDNGASAFCRKLGYNQARLDASVTKVKSAYEADAIAIGRCLENEDITSCTGSHNKYALEDWCTKGNPVSIEIECSKKQEECYTTEYTNKYLSEYPDGATNCNPGSCSFDEAKAHCNSLTTCNGVTREGEKFTVRAGTLPAGSKSGESSWLKIGECTVCQNDGYRQLVGRGNECDWNGVDSEDRWTLGGGSHTKQDCIDECNSRQDCSFAALSDTGYCHGFKTCNNEPIGGAKWQVYQKCSTGTLLFQADLAAASEARLFNTGRRFLQPDSRMPTELKQRLLLPTMLPTQEEA